MQKHLRRKLASFGAGLGFHVGFVLAVALASPPSTAVAQEPLKPRGAKLTKIAELPGRFSDQTPVPGLAMGASGLLTVFGGPYGGALPFVGPPTSLASMLVRATADNNPHRAVTFLDGDTIWAVTPESLSVSLYRNAPSGVIKVRSTHVGFRPLFGGAVPLPNQRILINAAFDTPAAVGIPVHIIDHNGVLQWSLEEAHSSGHAAHAANMFRPIAATRTALYYATPAGVVLEYSLSGVPTGRIEVLSKLTRWSPCCMDMKKIIVGLATDHMTGSLWFPSARAPANSRRCKSEVSFFERIARKI